MALDINIGKPTIGNQEFLGESTKNRYVIPPYQREYTWASEEWRDIYEDFIDAYESGNNHFIGTFMFISKEEENDSEMMFEVVDGQQRLTTLSLLLLALYQRLTEHKYNFIKDVPEEDLRYDKDTNDYIKQLEAVQNKLLNNLYIYGGHEKKLKLSLSLCSNNNTDYEQLVNGVYDYCSKVEYTRPGEEKPKRDLKCDQRKKIFKAYEFFYQRLGIYINEKEMGLKDTCDSLMKLAESLHEWQTICIYTKRVDQAYQLFDSLNNRGVALSPVDIVKNKLFKELSLDGMELDDAQEEWAKLLGRIKSEKLLRRFFVDYYNISSKKYQSLLNRKNPLTENHIIDKYTELIDARKKEGEGKVTEFYIDLLKVSEIYQVIIEPESLMFREDKKGTGYEKYMYPLIQLNAISAIPSFGFLTHLYDKLGLLYISKDDDEKFEEKRTLFCDVVSMLSRFFTLRHLTDMPRVKYLPELFDEWLKPYLGASELSLNIDDYHASFLEALNDKKFRLDTWSNVEKKLQELEYEAQSTRKAMIRYLFTLYELNHIEVSDNCKDAGKIFWESNQHTKRGEYDYSIEHIIPEGGKIKGNAQKYWAEVLGEDIDKRNEFVHKLGNLLLLKYNLEAGQKPFNEKLEKYLSTRYAIHDTLINHDTWTRTDVEERTNMLSKIFAEYLCDGFIEKEIEE